MPKEAAMLLSRRRIVSLVALVASVAVVVPAATVAAPPTAGQVHAVTNWNRIASATLLAFPPAAGGAPPALQIHMGMTQGAVYDAVNAIQPRHHQPYLLQRRFGATSSKNAAVATAAYRVLSSIVAGVPASIPFANRGALLQSLATEYAASLAAVPNGPSKRKGIAAGTAAANAMIAARRNDGRYGPSPWVPNPAPGHWQPLLNPDGTQALDPTPWVAGVKPFLLTSSSQFRTAGPQDLGSAAWAADFNEVKAIGSLTSTLRTPEQTHIALWWQSAGGPTILFNAVARDLAENPAYGLNLGDAALLLAKMNLAGADAAINCWNDKYHYDFWRPWNAIPRAAEDGNAATEPDPNWTPLLAAPYPEHASGHLCLDSVHLRVLQMFFGRDDIGFNVTSSRFNGETRHFDSFSAPITEVIEARIWAGLHYRTADVQAVGLGTNVAEYMAAHYFKAVGR
jgi:hypothetical protein